MEILIVSSYRDAIEKIQKATTPITLRNSEILVDFMGVESWLYMSKKLQKNFNQVHSLELFIPNYKSYVSALKLGIVDGCNSKIPQIVNI